MGFLKALLGRPEPDDFAALMISALRDRGMTEPVSYHPQEFKLSVGKDSGHFFYLHNAYSDYRHVPRRRRREVVEHYLRTISHARMEIPQLLDDAIAHVLPVVRSRSYFELNKLRNQTESLDGWDAPYRILTTDIAIGLGYDRTDAISILSAKQLDTWKISFEELLQRAQDNLWEISTNRFHSPHPGVYASPYGDSHDAARLLYWELIVQNEVKGIPVIAVPDRDTLIITGSEDLAGLEYMAAACETALEQIRLVSTKPLILDDRRWTALRLPEDHPLYARFRMCEMQETMSDYNEQKDLLQTLYEQKGEDVFVSTFSATKNQESGRISSYCVWSNDVVADLPHTDRIAFMPDEKEILGWGSWAEATTAFGHLMQKNVEYPERYRVESFPTPEQLGQIRLEK